MLITGVCGTIGKELLRQLCDIKDIEIVGIDNNESEIFFLDVSYQTHSNVGIFLCDIRERNLLGKFFEGVDIVIHTAALKHVIVNEKSPNESILTNITGTQNVIDASIAMGVERLIYTSSDKAVNPTNVMGTSKLMGERLITAANAFRSGDRPIMASTRFGNVLGSNGSVIPLFKKQIASGGPVTVTDERMSRFVMTQPEAVRLVMDSVFLAKGGEVFVTKMPVVNIMDLAHVMVDLLAEGNIDINEIGSKPGEKLYEELMNEEETRRTIELSNYFVITPAFQIGSNKLVDYTFEGQISSSVSDVYRSDLETSLTREELKNYLLENKLV